MPHDPTNNVYKLYGYKWFSSATDSDITITLARAYDDHQNQTKGLTMFLARTRHDDGSLNGIEIHKLKNKLGTRQVNIYRFRFYYLVVWFKNWISSSSFSFKVANSRTFAGRHTGHQNEHERQRRRIDGQHAEHHSTAQLNIGRLLHASHH